MSSRTKKSPAKRRNQIREFFSSLPQPSGAAIETVGVYRWLWMELEPLVDGFVLCDARGARAFAGRRMKTNREDALNLVLLLADGRLPLAWVPPENPRRGGARRRSRPCHAC